MTDNHTPTPWTFKKTVYDLENAQYGGVPVIEHACVIIPEDFSDGGDDDVDEFYVSREANAEFIVRACNSYYQNIDQLNQSMDEASKLRYINRDLVDALKRCTTLLMTITPADRFDGSPLQQAQVVLTKATQ